MIDKEEELRMTMVTTIICSSVMNESLDELKETNFYQKNKKLKSSGNQFGVQIDKYCTQQVNDLWKYDEIAASDLTQALRNIGKYVSGLQPSGIVALSQRLTIKKY